MTYYVLSDYPTSTQVPGVTFPIIRTPEWDTDVQIALSGRRTAFARRIYPRYKYELIYTFLRTSTTFLEWQTLQAFYNTQNGRAGLWVYTDQDDNSATAQNFGTGDSTTTVFQLTRTQQGVSGFSFIEPVFAVKTAAITVGSSAVSTGAGQYTIGVSGAVTFTSPPPSGQAVVWTGTFGWYCRFDEDINQFEKMFYNMYELKKVKFSSETF